MAQYNRVETRYVKEPTQLTQWEWSSKFAKNTILRDVTSRGLLCFSWRFGRMCINIDIDIFVSCNWVVTRWQQYSTVQYSTVQYSTVHIYTQTVHRTTQLIWEECGPCSIWASYNLAFALQLMKAVRCCVQQLDATTVVAKQALSHTASRLFWSVCY